MRWRLKGESLSSTERCKKQKKPHTLNMRISNTDNFSFWSSYTGKQMLVILLMIVLNVSPPFHMHLVQASSPPQILPSVFLSLSLSFWAELHVTGSGRMCRCQKCGMLFLPPSLSNMSSLHHLAVLFLCLVYRQPVWDIIKWQYHHDVIIMT